MFSKAKRGEKYNETESKGWFKDPRAPSITASTIHAISRHWQPTQLFSYALPWKMNAWLQHRSSQACGHNTSPTAHFGPNKTPTGSFKVEGLPYISINLLMPPVYLPWEWDNSRLQLPTEHLATWDGCTAWQHAVINQPACRKTQMLAHNHKLHF